MKRIFLWVVLFAFSALTASAQTIIYSEDFESGPAGWTPGGTPAALWELGTPVPGPPNIEHLDFPAPPGTQSWVTDLDDDYGDASASTLTSPAIDFSTAIPPVAFSASIFVDTEFSWDGLRLEYSVDGGGTWTTVGTSTSGVNWYNDNEINTSGPFGARQPGWTGRNDQTRTIPTDWFTATHLLPNNVVGQPDVRFRFVFDADIFYDDGVGVDNISILDQANYPNLAVLAINSPNSGQSLTNAEALTVDITNTGFDATTDPILNVTLVGPTTGVAGSVSFTETLTGTTIAPGDVVNHTFTTPLDLSIIGDYTVTVEVSTAPGAIADPFLSNNTSQLNVTHQSVLVPRIGTEVCVLDERFDNGLPAGWQNITLAGVATDVWRFDNPGNQVVPPNMQGGVAIFDGGNYSTTFFPAPIPEQAALVTEAYDFSMVTPGSNERIVLTFDHWFDNRFGGDILVGFTDPTGTIFNIANSNPGLFGTPGSAPISEQTNAAGANSQADNESYDLTALLAGRSDISLVFLWVGNNSEYWMLDNVKLCRVQNDDIPLSVECSPTLSRCANLSWRDSTLVSDNFIVQRATDLTNFGNWQTLVMTDTSFFQDCNAIEGQTYYYRTQYITATGFSEFSNIDSVVVSDCNGSVQGGLEPYEAVLSAEPGHQAAYLSWNAADPGHNVRGYEIYYSVGTDQGMVRAARIDEMTTYTVLGLVNGFDYYFKIRPIYEDFTFGEYSNIEMVRPSIILDANEELTASDVRVFPNPNSGTFRLALDRMPQGSFTVEVLSMTGQKVFSQSIENAGNNYQLEVSLPEAASGLYLLNLHTEQGTIQKKVNILR